MSLDTTGELAKKCNVSVRTIQYYDERGILVPTDLTECAVFLANYWYKRIEYICPECHTRFQPKKLEAFFGNHTPKMRKLTCPTCRRKIWSLEVYRREVDV
ncbi:MAG: MerR family DNA-binding transcriptional regulator [Lachnospiraceae bacterium]|nr:MerR family DNA-binding transcriptional regulator [Lachnospiraceae bacterium]